MTESRKGLVERLFAEHRRALQAFFYRRIRTKKKLSALYRSRASLSVGCTLFGGILPALATAALINGTADPDVLEGTPEADAIDGRGGDDTMMGLGGDDIYIVRQAGDEVIEGAGEGTDTIKASVTYALPIYTENLVLNGTSAINGTGNALANRLTGNAAKNILNGRAGVDVMVGRGGDDAYFVNLTDDIVTEYPDGGIDTVNASATYTLPQNVEKLVLTGSGVIHGVGNDLANAMSGNANDNVLNGTAGDDTLNGRAGNDALIGGRGNDRLTGGTGQNTFQFDAPLDSATNVDRITDFDPSKDTLRLFRAAFAFPALSTTGILSADAFRLGAAAADPGDRILYDPDTGALRYDADGSGPVAAVRFATLATGLAVTHSDFLVTADASPPPLGLNVTGNWQFRTTSADPGPPLAIAGGLVQSGGSLNGAVHVSGSNCFDPRTTIALTGTLAGSNVSLTSTSVDGQLITLMGDVAYDGLAGTYTIIGGCANSVQGNLTGRKVIIGGLLPWRIIFSWNDQYVLHGLATLTMGSASPEGSTGIRGTVSDSLQGRSCFTGVITPGTFPSASYILGTSVKLKIKPDDGGTVIFLGTSNGYEIYGRYHVVGGACDGLSGGGCLSRNYHGGCRLPPY